MRKYRYNGYWIVSWSKPYDHWLVYGVDLMTPLFSARRLADCTAYAGRLARGSA